MDCILAFDTTGSMAPCIRVVRKSIKELVDVLVRQFTDVRVGIIMHGDYCDEKSSYVAEFSGFSRDADLLGKWIDSKPNTGGGDSDECYEYVMNMIAQSPWRDGNKVAIMVGDAHPHERGYVRNRYDYPDLDWREEKQRIEDAGIALYTIQCLTSRDGFWDTIPVNQGIRLWLSQFNDIATYLEAIAYRNDTKKLDSFETKLKTEFRMNRAVAAALNSIRTGTSTGFVDLKKDASYIEPTKEGFIPVSPERFQVLKVADRLAISGFVTNMGCTFKKGRGFYELTKRETIQERKEVVLRDIRTGDMFSGSDARDMIGLPFGKRGRIGPREIPRDIKERYRVFIQSTSYNRVLMPSTWFLYENEAK